MAMSSKPVSDALGARERMERKHAKYIPLQAATKVSDDKKVSLGEAKVALAENPDVPSSVVLASLVMKKKMEGLSGKFSSLEVDCVGAEKPNNPVRFEAVIPKTFDDVLLAQCTEVIPEGGFLLTLSGVKENGGDRWGHAIAASLTQDAVTIMDPNVGEYRFERPVGEDGKPDPWLPEQASAFLMELGKLYPDISDYKLYTASKSERT